MERLTNEPDSATYSPGVDRALEILERLGSEPLTLSELSASLGFPKNAVFRITNTLKARGYLARDEKTLKFRLTDKLLRVKNATIRGPVMVLRASERSDSMELTAPSKPIARRTPSQD